VGRRFLAFIFRRSLWALALVLVVASAALILARLAPGDHLSAFEADPAAIAAERHRLGLDRPIYRQYLDWIGRAVRLDWGESTAHAGRSVASLIAERARHSAIIGIVALAVATALGIPLGIFTGTRRRGLLAASIQALAILSLSIPPMVLALSLLLLAARTGWFPIGGPPATGSILESARHVVLPVVALAVPIAAALERLQSRAIASALAEPSILAARARGLSMRRVIWRHAFRLSLKPVVAVYGIMIGALISGSFVVEYVMTWPGLGRLMYEALIGRDANLVAGCAATGAAFLALGVLFSDVLLAAIDPRFEVS
jgi:peptide/nickel transport system permease protein